MLCLGRGSRGVREKAESRVRKGKRLRAENIKNRDDGWRWL